MVDIWVEFVKALWLLIPAYAANGFAPLARGKKPIDFRKFFIDNQRILGDGKTIEGFLLGVFVGTLVGALETYLFYSLNIYASQWNVSLPYMSLFIGFMISFGAMSGDLVGSFIKRRFRLEKGANVPLLDQWNFVIGAVVFSIWFTEITIWMFLIMLIITPLIHRIACMIGYKLKLKMVPW